MGEAKGKPIHHDGPVRVGGPVKVSQERWDEIFHEAREEAGKEKK